jgi:alkaline phosphatase D
MKHSIILTTFLFLGHFVFGQATLKPQNILAGPMMGHVELRTAILWLEVTPNIKNISVKVWKKGDEKNSRFYRYNGKTGNLFNRIKIDLHSLEPGTSYEYVYLLAGAIVPYTKGTFTTQHLWQWRRPAPDFSFLTGSCAYFNEPKYDRPGKPYGQDSSIFYTMAKEPQQAFMLWLGDNWYTRDADYFSAWGLHKRASTDRSSPSLQPFLKAMPHYAIWDDHDYGPDNADKSFGLKDDSREVFMESWCNPTFGQNGEGVYSTITYNDLQVFLLDDRWFRSNDKTPDSIEGKPNLNKRMFGEMQMEWLKNSLRGSNTNPNIKFRIIATGSQVLNPISPADCFRHFSTEYNELMTFLATENIQSVLFLTGDRHLSQVIKLDRPGRYPLYDVTVSSLTAGSARFNTIEKNLPAMVLGIDGKQNYAKITIAGEGLQRTLSVNYFGLKGEKLGEFKLSLKDITSP